MVFGIGNFSPVSLLATAALGPAGGIVGQLATQLFSQVGQQMIQQMGQRLGVPQSQIDFVQSAFANQHGDYQGGALNIDEAVSALGRETNASPADIGRAQGDVQETLNRVLDDLSQGEDVKDARAGGRGKGWLMALAQVLGAKMDRLADDMGSMAREISDGAASKSSEFTVLAQEFGLVMNAATTSIKTIGEAMNSMARKQ